MERNARKDEMENQREVKPEGEPQGVLKPARGLRESLPEGTEQSHQLCCIIPVISAVNSRGCPPAAGLPPRKALRKPENTQAATLLLVLETLRGAEQGCDSE